MRAVDGAVANARLGDVRGEIGVRASSGVRRDARGGARDAETRAASGRAPEERGGEHLRARERAGSSRGDAPGVGAECRRERRAATRR